MPNTPNTEGILSIPPQFCDRIEYNVEAHKRGVDQRYNPGVQPHQKYQYYADRRKRWPFYTDKFGASQLIRLFYEVDKCMEICHIRLEQGVQLILNEDSQSTSSSSLPKTQEELEQVKEQLLHDGEDIYSEKKNLKMKYVTWSQKEYDHPGFQHWYLKLKSIQRYTETYALVQRLYSLGYFSSYITKDREYRSQLELQQSSTSASTSTEPKDNESSTPPESSAPIPPDASTGSDPSASSEPSSPPSPPAAAAAAAQLQPPPPFICVSLGGGPAFEILAVQHFFERICPSTPFIGYSLDLSSSWKEYVESLGYHFAEWDGNDMNKGQTVYNSLKQAGYHGSSIIDMCLISYAFLMYMGTPEHQQDLFNMLINYNDFTDDKDDSIPSFDSVDAIQARSIVISERSPKLSILQQSEQLYNVHIHRLVNRNDDRQLLVYKNHPTSESDSDHIQDGGDTPIGINYPHYIPPSPSDQLPIVYPNVPYEDNLQPAKQPPRGRGSMYGSHRGGNNSYHSSYNHNNHHNNNNQYYNKRHQSHSRDQYGDDIRHRYEQGSGGSHDGRSHRHGGGDRDRQYAHSRDTSYGKDYNRRYDQRSERSREYRDY